jgi:ParB family chromosome partitioning protein
LALPDDETMIRAAEQIVAQDLNVRQAEELTRRWLAPAERAEEEKEAEAPADERETAYTRRLEEDFRTALGTKVSLARGRRGGKLVIHFYSDEELQAIYDHIVSASERA